MDLISNGDIQRNILYLHYPSFYHTLQYSSIPFVKNILQGCWELE